jgi:hypothetical protein
MVSKLKEQTYSLGYKDWPNALKKEAKDIFNYHTMPYGKIKASGLKRKSKNTWSSKKNKCCSFQGLIDHAEHFFGFLINPPDAEQPNQRGLGLEKDLLSFSLFANMDIVFKFFNFLTARQNSVLTEITKEGFIFPAMLGNENANEVITNGILRYAKILLPLLRPEGYLPQHADYADKYFEIHGDIKTFPLAQLNSHEKINEWKKNCERTVVELDDYRKSESFSCIRDVMEPLQKILDKNIFKTMADILNKMKKDATLVGLTNRDRAVRYRDYILVKAHFLTGLRAEHYSFWEIDKHICIEGSKVDLSIFREDLKTAKTETFTKVKLELPFDFAQEIINYIKEYRPLLTNRESKLFFTPSKNSNYKNRKFEHIRNFSISRIFSNAMLYYSQSQSGFGSHGARRILNTCLDKKRGMEDFSIGTTLLMHSQEVNNSHYTDRATNIENAFRYHIWNLQRKGVLPLPPPEERIVSIRENDLNRLNLRIKELELMCRQKSA